MLPLSRFRKGKTTEHKTDHDVDTTSQDQQSDPRRMALISGLEASHGVTEASHQNSCQVIADGEDRVSSQMTPKICDACSDLDLKAAIQGRGVSLGFGDMVAVPSKFSPSQAWKATTIPPTFSSDPQAGCEFCQFLARVYNFKILGQYTIGRPYNIEYLGTQGYVQSSQPAESAIKKRMEPAFRFCFDPKFFRFENGFFAINENLVSRSDGAADLTPTVIPPKVSPHGMLKPLIEQCKRTDSCYLIFGGSKDLPRKMRVIDCHSRQVVAAPKGSNFEYVTLSYVWGGPGRSKFQEDLSSIRLPATIEDAITVTKELGYQYLWVAMLCIKQDDDNDLEAQLPLMDRVYAESEVTIVAAAAKSSHDGLYGISVDRLPDHFDFAIDEFKLRSFIIEHWNVIRYCTWNTRG